MLYKFEVPVLGVMEVGESAIDEGAHEVQCQRASFVAAQEQRRIGSARLLGELRTIDIVAAKRGQLDAVFCLSRCTARLGVLPCKTANSHDALARSVHQDQTHLQEDLEFGRDGSGRAIGETLRAIATPKHEPFTACRLGQGELERLNLIARHQRRKRPDFVKNARER